MSAHLVTGATGSLGPFLIHRLLHDPEPRPRLVCLVRRPDAPARLRRRIAAICPACAGRVAAPAVRFARGDVTRPIAFDGRVDAVWHFAADLRMDPRAGDAVVAANLQGTRQVLDYCARAGAALGYVSTAYVCGDRSGRVFEHELFRGQAFRNPYEASKARAEALVQEWLHHHAGMVFRPSIVIGDTRTGVSLGFHGLYRILWALWSLRERAANGGADATREIPLAVPCRSPTAGYNLVGVDYATALMLELWRRPDALGHTFHVTNPEAPTLQSLLEATAALFHVRGLRLQAIEPEELPALVEAAARLDVSIVNEVGAYLPYLVSAQPVFDMSNVARVCGTVPAHPPLDEAALGRLCRYAVERRFRAGA